MAFSVIDLHPPFQISKVIKPDDINISTDILPKQFIDGTIRVGGSIRCKLLYEQLTNRGGYGSIYRAKRVCNKRTDDICVKIPHVSSYSLCSEAIVQWIAFESLKKVGVNGAIPEIYDIFQYAGETRIAMSFIEGACSLDWIMASQTPEKTFLQMLKQLSLILAYLEETIYFDHRDLKGDNIWIRPVPVEYSLTIGGKPWTLSCPFQVVILDFGFSCMGGKDGNAVINLSDNILPKIDPCPKEGRDLFQFIASLWAHSPLRSKMGEELQREIDILLSYKNKPYASLVRQTIETRWVYLLVSDLSFSHPPLHPLSLLQYLS